jgi:ribosomal protein L17
MNDLTSCAIAIGDVNVAALLATLSNLRAVRSAVAVTDLICLVTFINRTVSTMAKAKKSARNIDRIITRTIAHSILAYAPFTCPVYEGH